MIKSLKLTELVRVLNLVNTGNDYVRQPGSAVVRDLLNHVLYLDIHIPP